METRYNLDNYSNQGIEPYYAKRVSTIDFCKKGLVFANRNDVTTISNWAGIVIGIVGLITMVVF